MVVVEVEGKVELIVAGYLRVGLEMVVPDSLSPRFLRHEPGAWHASFNLNSGALNSLAPAPLYVNSQAPETTC